MAKSVEFRELFNRIFEPSPAHIAMLDQQGVIRQTNAAWRNFGLSNGLSNCYDCVGKNYLGECEAALRENNAEAAEAYLGLLKVLQTQRPKFAMIYTCHSPTELRWFRMWVEPQAPAADVVIVAHYLYQSRSRESETGSDIMGRRSIGGPAVGCASPDQKSPY